MGGGEHLRHRVLERSYPRNAVAISKLILSDDKEFTAESTVGKTMSRVFTLSVRSDAFRSSILSIEFRTSPEDVEIREACRLLVDTRSTTRQTSRR